MQEWNYAELRIQRNKDLTILFEIASDPRPSPKMGRVKQGSASLAENGSDKRGGDFGGPPGGGDFGGPRGTRPKPQTTTLMLRNIPNALTPENLMAIIDMAGCADVLKNLKFDKREHTDRELWRGERREGGGQSLSGQWRSDSIVK